MIKTNNENKKNYGDYFWRGGQKIELEKMDDRFTIMPSSSEHLTRMETAPGVREVKPITNQVYKVLTTITQRDSTMSQLRSEPFQAIVHHAYRLKNAEGTVYYLTDKIIVHFDPKATQEEIDKLLNKYALKVLKEYEHETNMFLLQITSDSGGNPIKVANQLVEEKLVLSANSNLSAAEVKDILHTTADKIIDPDPDIILGTNRGKYDNNGHCDWFGFGKVNAAKAVSEAVRRKNNA